MSKVDALVLLITEMNYVLMLYQYLPRYLELKKAKSLYCTATVSPRLKYRWLFVANIFVLMQINFLYIFRNT